MAIIDETFRIITKSELMKQLGIEPNQLVMRNHTVTEKLFCAAILDAGTDVASQILRKYNVLKDILDGNYECSDPYIDMYNAVISRRATG